MTRGGCRARAGHARRGSRGAQGRRAAAARLQHRVRRPHPGGPRAGRAARAAGGRRRHRGAARRGRPRGVAVLRFRPSLWSQVDECYLAELYVVPGRRGSGLGRAAAAGLCRPGLVRAAATSSTCRRARTTSRRDTSTSRRASAAPRARAARWPSTTSSSSESAAAHPGRVMTADPSRRDDRGVGQGAARVDAGPWSRKGSPDERAHLRAAGARLVPACSSSSSPRWRVFRTYQRGWLRQGPRRRPGALRAPRAAGHGLRRARRAAAGHRSLHLDPLPARLRHLRPVAHPRARARTPRWGR